MYYFSTTWKYLKSYYFCVVLFPLIIVTEHCSEMGELHLC